MLANGLYQFQFIGLIWVLWLWSRGYLDVNNDLGLYNKYLFILFIIPSPSSSSPLPHFQ